MGVSAGYNSAKPSDQDFTVGGVTVANGRYGGATSWGRARSDGNYYSVGWAGGRGVALQGPTLMGVSYSFDGEGASWSGEGR